MFRLPFRPTLFTLLTLFALVLAACADTPAATPDPTATSAPAPSSTPSPTDEPTAVAEPTADPTPLPEPTDAAETAEEMDEEAVEEMADEEEAELDPANLSDAQILDLMYDMTDGSRAEGGAALELAVASNDERFIPVLIETLRFAQLGVVQGPWLQGLGDGLESLTGEAFGFDWERWVEWYGNTDIVPHPEFIEWKGRGMTVIDPRFAQFFVGSHPSTLRPEEIQWGGVQLDGIPALDQAEQIPAADAAYMNPQDPVFGIALNGEAHAYPLRIIDWHEMANDVVGGVPVSLAYCTLCGAAVAYDGRGNDGTTYDFGSSGFLYRSNKLMYDRQTLTLWNQLTGEPVLGELAGTDLRLDLLPVVLTTWEEWQAQHPETLVLSEETGFRRDYTPGAAYGTYFSRSETMFPVPQRSGDLETKDQIYALTINGEPKAYPIGLVAEAQVINDVHADTNVVVVGTRGTVDVNRGETDVAWYSAGSEIRVFDRGEREFFPTDDPDVLLDADGATWRMTEEALVNDTGDSAERIPGHLAYWFGWYAFFPNTAVYGQ